MTGRVHELKCWPAFWDAVASGAKTFEVRKNDRGFQAGDSLVLLKWDPETANWVTPAGDHRANRSKAASVTVRVAYVLSGWGIEPGYVCMGIRVDEPHDHDEGQHVEPCITCGRTRVTSR